MNIITETVVENKYFCHTCGDETEYQCRSCEQPVCEGCAVPFTYKNQIDYTLCNNCHVSHQEARAEELFEEGLTPNQLKKHRRDTYIVNGLLKAIKKRFGE